MTARSAGLLLFRAADEPATDEPATGIEVLLGHSGGPFFARRETGAWSIPKGEYLDDEPPLDAARREFTEELGLPIPQGELLPLGEAKQKNGKIVTIWALRADLDPRSITPGTFEMEWPRGSGRQQQFPEIDRVQWFRPEAARPLMFAGQQVFLERLAAVLNRGPS